MKISSAVLFFLMAMSCVKKEKEQEVKAAVAKNGVWESEEYGLDKYFEKYEIEPTAVFYNKQDSSEIVFFNHRVKWTNKGNHIQLNIDGNALSLNGETTLNTVWGNNKDSVHFANDWDEMKYYRSKDHELIGIRMHFNPCNGLGCSVNYFLWYDLTKKTKNYFGTFRTENKLAIYSFNNNDSIDYLGRTFTGDAHGATEMNFITELYSLDDKGKFVLQKDSNGDPYRITQTTFPNDTINSGDKVTMHWFEIIKE